MKNHFKILVATDYSKAAENAVRYALQLAKSTGSEINFLHVFQKSLNFPTEFVELERIDDSPIEFELRNLEQSVEEHCDLLKIHRNELKYNCKVIIGHPIDEIFKAAREINADFIILGTHVAGAVKRAFFVSHTWEAIKQAQVPILAIPAECTYSDLQNIVFATEYRPSELPMITYLAKFAKQFNAELTVVHIANNVFSAKFEHELFADFRKQVQDKIDYSKLNIRLVTNNDLAKGLNDFCTRTKSSWLVMSHEKTSLLMSMLNPLSLTKKMSFFTHVPLYAVPDGYKPLELDKYENIKSSDFFVEKNLK